MRSVPNLKKEFVDFNYRCFCDILLVGICHIHELICDMKCYRYEDK